MAGWHHWLDGRESEWTLGVGKVQRGLACCNSWGCKESDTTEQLNWTELIQKDVEKLTRISNIYKVVKDIPLKKYRDQQMWLKLNFKFFKEQLFQLIYFIRLCLRHLNLKIKPDSFH